MDSEIPELHCHSHTVFCIGHNFEITISGEMLGTPTQCHTFVIYDDTGQKTRLNSFHSVWQQQASLQKLGPLKILIGSCTDLNVDSGSCFGSNLKYRLRLLLPPKMQTPAGVHSGSVIISGPYIKSVIRYHDYSHLDNYHSNNCHWTNSTRTIAI